MITSLDAEKVFDNIKHSSIVWKDSSNYEYKWTSLEWLRVSTKNYSKHFKVETLEGIRQECLKHYTWRFLGKRLFF